MEESVEEQIDRYKPILLTSWAKLKENKNVGLSIYDAIVYGSKLKSNGSSRPTSSIFFDQKTDLEVQSSRFMGMLDTVILKLDEPSLLILKLNQLSKTHSSQYHVQRHNYMDFKNGFMKTIKIELHQIWSKQHDNAWKWFWQWMISKMSPDDIHENDAYDDNEDNIEFDILTGDNNQINDGFIDENDIMDINQYYIETQDKLSNSLKTMNIPCEIIEIIALYSLNLTTFYKDQYGESINIGSCKQSGNINCTATRISNKHYPSCGTVISSFWISNKFKSPLNHYMHEIRVIVEREQDGNGDGKQMQRGLLLNRVNQRFEVCIGFTSKVTKHHLEERNGFVDLECGFGVTSWNKRLIHHGRKSTGDTLSEFIQTAETDEDDDNLSDDAITHKLQQRIDQSMKLNDTLTFIVDMNDDTNTKSTIYVLLNAEKNISAKQRNDALKFTNIESNRLALCMSLWTIGIRVRIVSWRLIPK